MNIKKLKNKAKKQKTKFKFVEKTGNITRIKRARDMIFVVIIVFLGLLIRIGWIQFGMGDELKRMAYIQHTQEREFNSWRPNNI